MFSSSSNCMEKLRMPPLSSVLPLDHMRSASPACLGTWAMRRRLVKSAIAEEPRQLQAQVMTPLLGDGGFHAARQGGALVLRRWRSMRAGVESRVTLVIRSDREVLKNVTEARVVSPE